MKKLLPAILCIVLSPLVVRADAIVVTRAMRATTIAEIFVLSDSVRVEFEIGLEDLRGFRNLMPDAIYERLGFAPKPLSERFSRFFAEDWVVLADGRRLRGEVTNIVARPRLLRDEVTGEPLPAGDKESELTVYVELGYALSGEPKTMTFRAPSKDGTATTNIGFVLYHKSLPVTDFRYLTAEQTIDLDWKDPWYSRFRNRNLKRQFDAPLSAYLYIENYEVRKEIVVRPKDLEAWMDLGLESADVIKVSAQPEIKSRVVDFLAKRGVVLVDGEEREPTLDRIHFIRRSLRRTGVIDPPEDLPAVSATLGIIFVYPIDSLPDEVTMTWDLFTDRIQAIPAASTDEAGGLPYVLTPDDAVLTWTNFLTNPTVPMLVDLDAAPSMGSVSVPVISVLCGVLFIGVIVRFHRRRVRSPLSLVAGLTLVIVGVLLWPRTRVDVPAPFARTIDIPKQDTETIVSGLLTNVYRAFDFREEGAIYDALARSATGDLLTEIYIETRKALELQNQGGARVKVDAVSMTSVDAEMLSEDIGFIARCTWNVEGSVGHWGHIHRRVNQYDAEITIKSVGGSWRITALQLIEEERLSLRARSDAAGGVEVVDLW